MAQDDQKIDYVEFYAADFDAVQSFYEQAFGWTFVDYGPEYRAFNDGKLDGGFRKGVHRASTSTGSALVIVDSSSQTRTATSWPYGRGTECLARLNSSETGGYPPFFSLPGSWR